MLAAIQLLYVAAKDSIKKMLDSARETVPGSIEKVQMHKTLIRNYVDLYEQANLAPKGSHEDKYLTILIRSRQLGAKLTMSSVWDLPDQCFVFEHQWERRRRYP